MVRTKTQLTRRLSAELTSLGGIASTLRKHPHSRVTRLAVLQVILPRRNLVTFAMSQFLRPLALKFSPSWSRSCMIRTPNKQFKSFVKPLLWGTVSIFSAAYAVQSSVTVRLDAEPSPPNSEFESMFDCLTQWASS